MTLSSLLTQQATVLSQTAQVTDAEGNSSSSVTSSVIYPAKLVGHSSDEQQGARTVETTTWLLILPAAAAVGPHDRVLLDGVRYDVAAPPYRVLAGSKEHHVEVFLRAAS